MLLNLKNLIHVKDWVQQREIQHWLMQNILEKLELKNITKIYYLERLDINMLRLMQKEDSYEI